MIWRVYKDTAFGIYSFLFGGYQLTLIFFNLCLQLSLIPEVFFQARVYSQKSAQNSSLGSHYQSIEVDTALNLFAVSEFIAFLGGGL